MSNGAADFNGGAALTSFSKKVCIISAFEKYVQQPFQESLHYFNNWEICSQAFARKSVLFQRFGNMLNVSISVLKQPFQESLHWISILEICLTSQFQVFENYSFDKHTSNTRRSFITLFLVFLWISVDDMMQIDYYHHAVVAKNHQSLEHVFTLKCSPLL